MKGRILYMEDDAFYVDVLANKLKEVGFDVSVARDGEEGLATVRKGKYDIILLDLLMPKVDGFEVLKQLKNDPQLSTLPVVVLSNLGGQEDFNRTKELGASVFLVKAQSSPIDILNTVDQMLSVK